MKKFLSLASVMAIAGCLLSCNDVLVDDYAPFQSTPIAFSASIKQDYTTRINDEGFVGGDRMGVFVVDYVEGQPGTLQVEKNRADNVLFTYDATSNAWTGESDVYWKDKHSAVDVFGYYPYQRSVVNVEASLFEVATDQSIPASDGEMSSYEASDFLWAKAAGVTPDVSVVRLAYQHRMAGIFVTLVEGEGFSDGQWETLPKQVLVCNTRRTAEINLSTGVVTPIGELDKHIVPSVSGDNYRAVVVPQSVEADKALLSITIDGTNYFYTKPEAITYLPGRLHQFTMQVDKRSESGDYTFTLLTEEITPWQNDEASHSFETSTYVVVHVPEFVPLQQCIEAAGHNYLTLQNLKLTGRILPSDFTFMREKMPALKALNLKEVRLTNYEIPDDALKDKKLKALILPDQDMRRIGSYAFKNAGLTGSCIIPEGVESIGREAFYGNPFDGNLVLPTTLEVINDEVFYGCAFNCELKLPARLKSIGMRAFYRSEGQFQGELVLPEGLTYVGFLAFENAGFENQNFVIPKSLTKIATYAFYRAVKAQRLVLHDGITEIGKRGLAVAGDTGGELHLPASLKTIGAYGFTGGEYTSIHFPENIIHIDEYAFSQLYILKEVILPNSLRVIEDYTFYNCKRLESVYIPESIEYIDEGAFKWCGSLSIITCAAITPPILFDGAFDDTVLQNAILVVPESAIDAYRNAEGWKKFSSLAPRIEIESNVSVVKVANQGIAEKEIVLNTSGAWVVESMPDWCQLSQTVGEDRKTLLQLSIPAQSAGSGNRMGKIVLRLRDKEQHRTTIRVEQYDVTEGEEINLQTATRGPGIQFFLLGDGFDAQEVYEGKYLEAMRQQMENFFDIEPYRTYRDYFTVNTALVVSPESGIGSRVTNRITRFNTNFDGGYKLFSDYEAVRNYVVEVASGIEFNTLQDALVVLVANSSEFGGHTELWPDGSFLSVCPLSTLAAPHDTRGIIQHEAGGHGFAKLGDEDVEHYDFITACCCPQCNELRNFNEGKERGWYANLSLSDKINDLPWQHLIFDPRYSLQVDVFEGGFDHARAMYRSEESSIMRNYESYFNAISRETIVRRIMELVGEPFDFETFVANDIIINP